MLRNVLKLQNEAKSRKYQFTKILHVCNTRLQIQFDFFHVLENCHTIQDQQL